MRTEVNLHPNLHTQYSLPRLRRSPELHARGKSKEHFLTGTVCNTLEYMIYVHSRTAPSAIFYHPPPTEARSQYEAYPSPAIRLDGRLVSALQTAHSSAAAMQDVSSDISPLRWPLLDSTDLETAWQDNSTG